MLIASGFQPGEETHELTFSGGRTVALRGPHGLRLSVRHWYRVERIQIRPSRWQAVTVGYFENERELLAYHLHPGEGSSVAWPHLHISGHAGQLRLTGVHLPTERVELAAVVRVAIQDLGVRPIRADWPRLLGL